MGATQREREREGEREREREREGERVCVCVHACVSCFMLVVFIDTMCCSNQKQTKERKSKKNKKQVL